MISANQDDVLLTTPSATQRMLSEKRGSQGRTTSSGTAMVGLQSHLNGNILCPFGGMFGTLIFIWYVYIFGGSGLNSDFCLLPSLSTAPSPGLSPLISRAFGTTLFSIIDQHLRNISKFEKGENLEKGIIINSIFVSNNRRKDCVRRKPV